MRHQRSASLADESEPHIAYAERLADAEIHFVGASSPAASSLASIWERRIRAARHVPARQNCVNGEAAAPL
jgi:hypothetical protein